MPKKYVIYHDGYNLQVKQINNNETHNITYREYKKIIKKFIANKYSIISSNKIIVLRSKRKVPTTIVIAIDKNLMACKEFRKLKKNIDKVKTEKYLNQDSKRDYNPLYIRYASLIVAILFIIGAIGYSLNNKNKIMDNSDNVVAIADSQAKEKPSEETIAMPFNIGKAVLFFKKFIPEDDLTSSLPQEEPNEETYEEVNEYDEYLKTYAGYFHLNATKVIDFAKAITNNYATSFTEINPTTEYDLNNKEASCLIFVHELSKDNLAIPLQDYGYSLDYFMEDYTPTTLPLDKKLTNGESFEQFLGHICDLLQIDKNWVLGITYLETGSLTSSLAQNQNNFGGLRGSNGFYSYISPEAGIIAHCRNLKRYEAFGLQSIYELASKYVFGDTNLIYQINNNPNDPTLSSYYNSITTWASNVTYFHDSFVANSEQIFGSNNLS